MSSHRRRASGSAICLARSTVRRKASPGVVPIGKVSANNSGRIIGDTGASPKLMIGPINGPGTALECDMARPGRLAYGWSESTGTALERRLERLPDRDARSVGKSRAMISGARATMIGSNVGTGADPGMIPFAVVWHASERASNGRSVASVGRIGRADDGRDHVPGDRSARSVGSVGIPGVASVIPRNLPGEIIARFDGPTMIVQGAVIGVKRHWSVS